VAGRRFCKTSNKFASANSIFEQTWDFLCHAENRIKDYLRPTAKKNGASPKGVAVRLGHTNTHNTKKLQEETSAIFDKTLQTKNSKVKYFSDKEII